MNILNNLEYEIIYKKVKNINMRIKNDGGLTISAPHGVSTEEIEALVLRHYNKFYNAQQEIYKKNEKLNIKTEERDYIYIRGVKCNFEYIKDTKYSYSVKGDKVMLYYRNLDKDYEKMIREIAYKVFNQLGEEVSAEMGLPNLEIEEKKFSRCFGKNYGKKRIALNYKLIHMDDTYIKHVLYHEYTHCEVFNHSKKFYDLLSKFDKEHRKNKKYIGQNLYKFC